MQPIRRLALALAFGLPALTLTAALMSPLPVEELTQRAELILHGTVTSKTCQRSPEGRIYTRVELLVGEVWKGSLTTNTFALVHSGGTVGNLRAKVSGQVSYEVGEEVVAFLVVNSRGEGVTLGLAQGKFHVWKDKATGEKFAHNLFHGATERSASANDKEGKNSERLALKDLGTRAKGGAR